MFYQAGVVVKEQTAMLWKGGFYQRLGDICIGSIENFWVDKDLFEYWKHSHFTLDVIDAFGRRVFFGNAVKKDFQNWIGFTPEEEQSLEQLKYIE
jgi:uncharacterized protein (DUF779 family)